MLPTSVGRVKQIFPNPGIGLLTGPADCWEVRKMLLQNPAGSAAAGWSRAVGLRATVGLVVSVGV